MHVINTATNIDHTKDVLSVKFDGQKLVSAGLDYMVHVWDFETGKRIYSIEDDHWICA